MAGAAEQASKGCLQDAELVVPGVAHDPEVEAAELLVVVAGGAELLQAVNFGLDVGPVLACVPTRQRPVT